MNSITLSVVKELNCDVLVTGGGCAGLAAAIAATDDVKAKDVSVSKLVGTLKKDSVYLPE